MCDVGLKPCPFCGFEDVWLDGDEWEHINGEDGYVECFVYCPQCGRRVVEE